MKFPKSEHLGVAQTSDGKRYTLTFYGEDEGAAVVSGPSPEPGDGIVEVPEIHREPAADATEARAKLAAWTRTRGWTVDLI